MGHVYAAHMVVASDLEITSQSPMAISLTISDWNVARRSSQAAVRNFAHAKIHEVFWHLFDTGRPAYYGQTKDKQ